MRRAKAGFSIQTIQQRVPWIMLPLAWLDALTTPQRWAGLADRVATAISKLVVIDSTGIARFLSPLVLMLSRLRGWFLIRSRLLITLDWQVRKLFWAVNWALIVALRLWPRKVRIPTEEKVARLIPAVQSYRDFQCDNLLVPSDMPCGEQSLMGSISVQLLHLMQDIYPVITSHQPVASNDPRTRIRQSFPWVYRIVRTPPVWHQDLVEAAEKGCLLDVLAVGGPFAKLLERASTGTNEYLIDLKHMAEYPVREGLAPLGCSIHYQEHGGKLHITAIEYRQERFTPQHPGWDFAHQIALCSLVTHTTVWRHGMQYHVAGVAPFAAITHNLPPAHPIRRLLAPHMADTLSTDYHTHLTLRRSGFDVTGFSFSYETIRRYYDGGAKHFDFARLDPRLDIARRGIAETLDYPYRDQSLLYFEIFESYVREYVNHYYAGDAAIQADVPLLIWFDSVEHYLHGGIRHYAPELTREHFTQLCAVFLYTVTVEHEENTMWNYAVCLPTTVRQDGVAQSVGQVQSVMNFQMVISSAANRLMSDTSHLALDPGGAEIMERFQARLRDLQEDMEGRADRYWCIYPSDLEASVSA